jgi:phosphate:Na+ symporter
MHLLIKRFEARRRFSFLVQGRTLGLALLSLFLLTLTSCLSDEERVAALLSVRSGGGQTALPGQLCEEELHIEVLGPLRHSRAGIAKQRRPVAEVRVQIEALHGGGGATVESASEWTDKGGIFRASLRMGQALGDQYFKVTCPDFPEVKAVFFHVVNGLQLIGDSQETLAGDELPAPIQVRVLGEDQQPVAEVPVFFTLVSGSPEAKLSARRVLTNAEGLATTHFETAAGYTGKYEILAELGDNHSPFRSRGVLIRALAISRVHIVIGVLGGLGIFIFGMMLMSDGLQQFAGDRLKGLLQLFTGNRFFAMMAGVVVTSLIQSSSACTVMVVGFVNASLLSLTQAIGVILGASIGTTVTAQMVSFKLDGLALPAISIGVIFMLVAKKSQTRGVGNAILGFGLLFYGMTMMSSELKAIADFPTFVSFFRMFDCTPDLAGYPPFKAILGAIAVGTIMTMVVQSSSATVGLAIALADSGLINFYTAVPLILGDNIGTTITGFLAAINTNRTAMQTALAATITKVLGVLIMVPLFYLPWNRVPCFMQLVDLITSGEVFAETPENIGRHVAAAHTLFNICNVAFFLPLVNPVATMVRFILPDKTAAESAEKRLCYLAPHLLNTPSAALNQVLNALIVMTREAMTLSQKSIEALLHCDDSEGEQIRAMENRVDDAQHDIIDYLVKLTRRRLSERQSATIPIFMHCVNDVERIGDRAINIFDLCEPLSSQSDGPFSESAINEIREINEHINKLSELLIEGMSKNDENAIMKVVQLETEVKMMTSRFESNHETRLRSQACTVEKGVVYDEMLANLERIAAHLSNVAQRAKDMLQYHVDFMAPAAAAVSASAKK